METVPGFWQWWWSDKTVCDAINSAHDLTFVWEVNSEIVGFVCGHDLGFRAYLSELIVAPTARHEGIGRRLVKAVEEALRQRGQRVLIGDVWHEATSFYQALGWEPPDVVLLRHHLES